ncbi:hypothetical protein MLD38_025169 [Melastoma candidum]|uniref:Uncharacterized protein n=1 Tax=Melastoma candidum TaxID=119954 RepID=A0ACB9NUH2_9MYRT|nr:hypothetical protein MLD38_025169 [Melastoma candidum]
MGTFSDVPLDLDLELEDREEAAVCIQEAVRLLLGFLGEDPDSEGLRKTPLRVAKAFLHATRVGRGLLRLQAPGPRKDAMVAEIPPEKKSSKAVAAEDAGLRERREAVPLPPSLWGERRDGSGSTTVELGSPEEDGSSLAESGDAGEALTPKEDAGGRRSAVLGLGDSGGREARLRLDLDGSLGSDQIWVGEESRRRQWVRLGWRQVAVLLCSEGSLRDAGGCSLSPDRGCRGTVGGLKRLEVSSGHWPLPFLRKGGACDGEPPWGCCGIAGELAEDVLVWRAWAPFMLSLWAFGRCGSSSWFAALDADSELVLRMN